MDLYNASFNDEEPEMLMTLEDYEEAKQDMLETVDRGHAAKRLADNPDFKLLVLDGYFKAEVERLTGLMTCGSISKGVLEGCADSMNAIGKFKAYFSTATQEGAQALEDLKDLEAARDEAIRMAEEGETQPEV